tara:strand:+ start:15562 stop:15945 length:384 start_codon:yes stop_codon:yes gene_type:complete
MKILLDTNFILTCVKRKIDFISLSEEIFDEPLYWMVPQDILNELMAIKNKLKIKILDKNSANLSLEILKKIDPEIIKLHSKNPNVDEKIIDYLKNKKIVLATMDKNLKKKVKNKILTIRGNKNLEII